MLEHQRESGVARLNEYAVNTSNSKKLFQQSKTYLLDGVASSFHKASFQEYPICFEKGKGSHLYDVDGNAYIDYVAGMGPLILGYSPDAVNEAVSRQLEIGTQFCSPTYDLFKLSKKLVEIIPCAEKIVFQNTGTEANMFVFRLARAYTGKSKIIKFEGQYHGWSDEEKISTDARSIEELGPRNDPWKRRESLGQLPSATENIMLAPWNDLDAIRRIIDKEGHDIAAIITEPFMCDSGPILPKKGYLEGLRQLATEHGILLIFDEVITGFRMALGGAQEYFGVTPDVAVFAKAISGGFPISVVMGKRQVMECGVHASGTFNGNAVSVAAALATINQLEQPGVYERFDHLGRVLTDGIRKLGEKYLVTLHCDHAGAICLLELGVDHPLNDFRECLTSIDQELYDRFVMRCLELGVRFTPNRGRIYLSTEHTEEDIQRTLNVIEKVFSEF